MTYNQHVPKNIIKQNIHFFYKNNNSYNIATSYWLHTTEITISRNQHARKLQHPTMNMGNKIATSYTQHALIIFNGKIPCPPHANAF